LDDAVADAQQLFAEAVLCLPALRIKGLLYLAV
jgi:hypothetical protein